MSTSTKAKRLVRELLTRGVGARIRYSRAGTNVIGEDVRGLAGVTFEGENLIHSDVNFDGAVSIGRATTIGSRSAIGTATIGRYCQFATDVALISVNHPTSKLSIYTNDRLLSGRMARHNEQRPIAVGNDVWIGRGASVLPGVTIGDGAVVGAGAVVTGNVPPYTIVGGIPARMIRRRFSEETVALLEELRWWDRPVGDIEERAWVFDLDLDSSPGAHDALRSWIAG